jgi:hypothetical protein
LSYRRRSPAPVWGRGGTHREGFEPPTDYLEGSCSGPLSYRRVVSRCAVFSWLPWPFSSALKTQHSFLSTSPHAPGRGRTCNPPVKSRQLCPLSYECGDSVLPLMRRGGLDPPTSRLSAGCSASELTAREWWLRFVFGGFEVKATPRHPTSNPQITNLKPPDQ